VDIGGPENTGIALANPNNRTVTISFSFNDTLGNTVGSGSFSLGAKHQFSGFLSQPPFNGPNSFEGSFTFTSSQSISAIALRGLTNERSDFLMTTLPVVAASDTSSSAAIPHFAVGGGWSTRLVLVNPTNDVLNGRVDFMDQGAPNSSASPLSLSVNDVRASGFNYFIPPHGINRVTLKSTLDGTMGAGSMRIASSNGTVAPSGLAIFSFNSGGVTVSEASVPIERQASALRIYAESSGNPGIAGSFRTGIAVANPSPNPTVINLALTQSDGTSTTLSASITIPAGGQIARFLDELIPNLPDTFKGLLRISAASPISAIGLRFTLNERGDYLMTTMPAASETVDASGGQEFFPQIVEGGGYTTQLVIFNRAAGSSVSGNLVFTASDGSPLSWQ
jgi:hypothetical protein